MARPDQARPGQARPSWATQGQTNQSRSRGARWLQARAGQTKARPDQSHTQGTWQTSLEFRSGTQAHARHARHVPLPRPCCGMCSGRMPASCNNPGKKVALSQTGSLLIPKAPLSRRRRKRSRASVRMTRVDSFTIKIFRYLFSFSTHTRRHKALLLNSQHKSTLSKSPAVSQASYTDNHSLHPSSSINNRWIDPPQTKCFRCFPFWRMSVYECGLN